MRIVLLLLLLEVFAFALNPRSCYTVQLISAHNSVKNYQKLSNQSYDESCRVLKIGEVLTVRCGCFDDYQDVKKHLQKMKKKYTNASIATTYKSRFSTKKQSKKIKRVDTETIDLGLKSIVSENITAKEVSITPAPSHKETVRVFSKEKRKISPLDKKIKKRTKIKKKKKKKKFFKKKERRFVYDRYINMLKHDTKGIGSYDYRYAFGSQISYDFAYISEEDANYKDRGLRRFRIWHDGSFFDTKLFYELEYSFTGNSHYKDLYIGYKDKVKSLDSAYRVKLGNIKIPFSLEKYTSSKYNTFMERALNDTFSISRKVGVEILYNQKIDSMMLNFFGAYFTNSVDERKDDEVSQPGFSTRVTLANKFDKREILHFGFGLKTQQHKGENVKFKQGAESNWIKNKYVSVKIKDVDSSISKNIEMMYINNKYYFQSEFTMEDLTARKGKYSFYGYYLQGSYFLLGRGKRFKMATSTMSKVKPKRDGALELAVRYSYINLNDPKKSGGEQQDVTLGVNWYIDDKLKISSDYIIANPKETDEYDGIFQLWQARVLFFF